MTAVASYAIRRRSDGHWYVGAADKKPRFAPAPTRPAFFTAEKGQVRLRGLSEDHDVELVPVATEGVVR
jgi:hypothetical protein